MLKKHFVFLLLAVMAIANANASTWKIHNAYVAKKMQSIFDTGDKVYYLNSGNLFQFDKATTNTIALNRQNVLSDNHITNIYYDWESRLLFVAYANSNIDVINNEGKVTNISNIKDHVVAVHAYSLSNGEPYRYVGKAISDITFGNGKAYIATGYGFVVIDEETYAQLRPFGKNSLNGLFHSAKVNIVSQFSDTRNIVLHHQRKLQAVIEYA